MAVGTRLGLRAVMAACAAACTAVCAAAAAGLSGCDRPGPLSAAAHEDLPPSPPPPAWAADLRNKPLKSVFATEGRCLGFVDGAAERFRDGRRIHGWAWSLDAGQPVLRLVAVDAHGRMAGFGEGGLVERPDVVAAVPQVASKTTGWTLVAPRRRPSYRIFGVDEARGSACLLGEAKP